MSTRTDKVRKLFGKHILRKYVIKRRI